MAAIERRTLKKAPARDVVDAFTHSQPEPQHAAAVIEEISTSSSPATAPLLPTDLDQQEHVPGHDEPVRRGPGRPRSKRRMEPFSSKLEIELRDAIDAYLFKHGGTFVDLLDEALRARIKE